MPTLKLRIVPDQVVSAAVPKQIFSAGANATDTNTDSVAVPDPFVSSHRPSVTDDRNGKREKKRSKCYLDAEESPGKGARVSSRAAARNDGNEAKIIGDGVGQDNESQEGSNAPLSGDDRCVGIKNPTGNKYVAQWNFRYGELSDYKEEHGHCLVSVHDEANKQLGRWVDTQRQQYRLLQQGKKSHITEERVAKLEAVSYTHLRAHET